MKENTGERENEGEEQVMQDFRRLVEICRGRRIYIQTHNFPDPDAIGSGFGLQRLLEKFGVEAVLCYTGSVDKLSVSKMLNAFQIQMFSYEELKGGMRLEDGIICVDCQKNGGNTPNFLGEEIACIDHHPVFVRETYLFEEICITGACASLIAGYYRELNIAPEKDVATSLLYGMRMDTLQFSRGVTQWDIEMFGYLFPFCDQELLSGLERNNMELRDLRAYGAVIDSIAVQERAGFAQIPFSCPDSLIAAMADFMLALEEVSLAVVFCRREDGIKISLRSEHPKIHAGYLIREVLDGLGDGGGHQGMAGGFLKAAADMNGMEQMEEHLKQRIVTYVGRYVCKSEEEKQKKSVNCVYSFGKI